jgi:hypothetical protein
MRRRIGASRAQHVWSRFHHVGHADQRQRPDDHGGRRDDQPSPAPPRRARHCHDLGSPRRRGRRGERFARRLRPRHDVQRNWPGTAGHERTDDGKPVAALEPLQGPREVGERVERRRVDFEQRPRDRVAQPTGHTRRAWRDEFLQQAGDLEHRRRHVAADAPCAAVGAQLNVFRRRRDGAVLHQELSNRHRFVRLDPDTLSDQVGEKHDGHGCGDLCERRATWPCRICWVLNGRAVATRRPR